eukprot:6214572-Pleurochrysis_carterae.AAC.4
MADAKLIDYSGRCGEHTSSSTDLAVDNAACLRWCLFGAYGYAGTRWRRPGLGKDLAAMAQAKNHGHALIQHAGFNVLLCLVNAIPTRAIVHNNTPRSSALVSARTLRAAASILDILVHGSRYRLQPTFRPVRYTRYIVNQPPSSVIGPRRLVQSNVCDMYHWQPAEPEVSS